nr:uncharacterized protein LOC119163459 isoform X2 [Rhipicephalus microplus]
MPRSCDVLGCPNGAGNSSVSYHVVPRDERRRSQWLAAVPMRKREGRAPPKLMVCSEHFSPSDYVYDPSLRQSLGCHQRPALSRSAVPSVARLTRNELVSLQQEILEGASDTGASILRIDSSNTHIEENTDVLPLVVSLVEGKPSPSWHQANKLICADSCVLPSRVTPADLRELARLSPLRNSYESISSTTSTSSEHVEFSPLDMLDVTLVEGQPLSLQSRTRTDDLLSLNRKDIGLLCQQRGNRYASTLSSESLEKNMQDKSPKHRTQQDRAGYHPRQKHWNSGEYDDEGGYERKSAG